MIPETNAQIWKCENSWGIFPKNVAMHVNLVTTEMSLKQSPIGALYTAPLNSVY